MIKLENFIERVRPTGGWDVDEFSANPGLAEIQAALMVAAELEADARIQLRANAEMYWSANGATNFEACIEQLHDAAELRERYVSRLISLVISRASTQVSP